MNKLQSLFSTPKKTVITLLCALIALSLLGLGGVYAAGAVAQSAAIGIDNAQNFAFADAGIDPVSAKQVHAEFDYEMGQFVYEVSFIADNTSYEYLIKSSDGTVLKKEISVKKADGTGQTYVANLTREQAKEAALQDAGLDASQVTFVEMELEREHGTTVYELTFCTKDTEYTYEINAADGTVYKKENKRIEAKPPIKVPETPAQPTDKTPADEEPNTRPADTRPVVVEEKPIAADKQPDTRQDRPATDSGKKLIGIEEAKKKALADAGVTTATFTKQKPDMDDGVQVYELEFHTSTHEYEYEINAITGAIREKNVEAYKSGNPKKDQPSKTEDSIGIEKAKSIAAKRAGYDVSQVTFKKAKVEHDDGRTVYEIEFWKNGMEYECTIDAKTGKILDYEVEKDD